MTNTNRMGRLPINNESLTFLMEVSTFDEAIQSLATINNVSIDEVHYELNDEAQDTISIIKAENSADLDARERYDGENYDECKGY